MRSLRRAKRYVAISLLAGTTLAALGPCSSNDLQTQLAGGMRTTINGLLNIAVTQFTNDLFGVNR